MTSDTSEQPTGADASPAAELSFLVLGRIMRPHGVRGEMRLQVITDYPDRISRLEQVYIGDDPYDPESAIAFTVEGTRSHRDTLLLRLEGISDRDIAETYRGKLLMVALEDAIPLEAGEFYVFELIGMEAITDAGESLGRITSVLETGANDVFVVTGGMYGEVLIPDIPEVVPEIDLENNRITVVLPPGLLPS